MLKVPATCVKSNRKFRLRNHYNVIKTMNAIPPVSPDNQAPDCACKKGGKICIATIACAALSIVLPLVGAGIIIGTILAIATLILSIIAIVKHHKAFGITMLVLSILIVGPASCTIGLWKDKNVREFAFAAQEQIEQNKDLINELNAAQAAGDTEKVKKLNNELQERIKNGLTEKLQKTEKAQPKDD